MKKITVIISALAMLASLTACDSKENPSDPDNSGSNSTVTSTPDSSDEKSDNLNNSEKPEKSDSSEAQEPPTPESKLSDEAKKLLENIRVESFEGHDGKTVFAADAVDLYTDEIDVFFEPDLNSVTVDTVLIYDFAYMRYMRPYFLVDPGGIPEDWSSFYDECEKEFALLPEAEWFKVRAGDKLDCGLTVKSAEYRRYDAIYNPLRSQTVEFDGELTLEGVLYVTNRGDYINSAGDLLFVPDTVKTAGLPIVSPSSEARVFQTFYPDYYVAADIGNNEWQLGSIDDAPFTRREIFGDRSAVKVKVTLNNIRAEYLRNMAADLMYADIVSIETID